jgi:hypothetical protein
MDSGLPHPKELKQTVSAFKEEAQFTDYTMRYSYRFWAAVWAEVLNVAGTEEEVPAHLNWRPVFSQVFRTSRQTIILKLILKNQHL